MTLTPIASPYTRLGMPKTQNSLDAELNCTSRCRRGRDSPERFYYDSFDNDRVCYHFTQAAWAGNFALERSDASSHHKPGLEMPRAQSARRRTYQCAAVWATGASRRVPSVAKNVIDRIAVSRTA